MPKARSILAISLLMASAACLGCRSTAMPTIVPSGSAEYQQQVGNKFDPYPDPDVGPPVVGGRPRDYQNPVSEPQRARFWNPINWFR